MSEDVPTLERQLRQARAEIARLSTAAGYWESLARRSNAKEVLSILQTEYLTAYEEITRLRQALATEHQIVEDFIVTIDGLRAELEAANRVVEAARRVRGHTPCDWDLSGGREPCDCGIDNLIAALDAAGEPEQP